MRSPSAPRRVTHRGRVGLLWRTIMDYKKKKKKKSLRISMHDQNGQKKDIVDYVTSVVNSDTKLQRWREEDRRLVIAKLSEKADGM
jgi:hypothetical protein